MRRSCEDEMNRIHRMDACVPFYCGTAAMGGWGRPAGEELALGNDHSRQAAPS